MSETLWNRCLRVLESELPMQQFNTWVRPLQVVERDGEIRLLAPNRYVVEWLGDNSLPRIKELIREFADGATPDVVLDVGTRAGTLPDAANASVANGIGGVLGSLPGKPRRGAPTVIGGRIAPEFTFDTFVEGKSNQLAKAAAVQVAGNPGRSYNPLFIYGGVGLGKTHLMHAVANKIKERNADARIAYVHSERFVSDMVKALQHNTINDFKTAYRTLDALMIDDIQFFAKKDRSQEEFFHTFNALLESQQQVILTCDRYPKEVDGLEERLKSRFGWGLTVAIEPPELETCVAILMSKAAIANVDLPEEVAFFVAKRIRSNVRELEGALEAHGGDLAFHRPRHHSRIHEGGVTRSACAPGETRDGGEHPKNRRGVLQNSHCRSALQAPQPLDRPPATSGDGACQRTHQLQLAGNRRCLRRPRPYDGAACLPAGEGITRVRAPHRRGLYEPVENSGGLSGVSCG